MAFLPPVAFVVLRQVYGVGLASPNQNWAAESDGNGSGMGSAEPTSAPSEVKDGEVPHAWFCEPELYSDGNDCHCNCGSWDPDCESSFDDFFCGEDTAQPNSWTCNQDTLACVPPSAPTPTPTEECVNHVDDLLCALFKLRGLCDPTHQDQEEWVETIANCPLSCGICVPTASPTPIPTELPTFEPTSQPTSTPTASPTPLSDHPCNYAEMTDEQEDAYLAALGQMHITEILACDSEFQHQLELGIGSDLWSQAGCVYYDLTTAFYWINSRSCFEMRPFDEGGRCWTSQYKKFHMDGHLHNWLDANCVGPTASPTREPAATPTRAPTGTNPPTNSPTRAPTNPPTKSPTRQPTNPPSRAPTTLPTRAPTTNSPTRSPSRAPTTPAPTTNSPTSSPSEDNLFEDEPTNSCHTSLREHRVVLVGGKNMQPHDYVYTALGEDCHQACIRKGQEVGEEWYCDNDAMFNIDQEVAMNGGSARCTQVGDECNDKHSRIISRNKSAWSPFMRNDGKCFYSHFRGKHKCYIRKWKNYRLCGCQTYEAKVGEPYVPNPDIHLPLESGEGWYKVADRNCNRFCDQEFGLACARDTMSRFRGVYDLMHLERLMNEQYGDELECYTYDDRLVKKKNPMYRDNDQKCWTTPIELTTDVNCNLMSRSPDYRFCYCAPST